MNKLADGLDTVARIDPSPTYVVTDYFTNPSNDRCGCCGEGHHRSYRNVLHDPVTDEGVELRKAFIEALVISGASDGDEVRLVVVKTGRRPFGKRRVVWTKPHTYEREPAERSAKATEADHG